MEMNSSLHQASTPGTTSKPELSPKKSKTFVIVLIVIIVAALAALLVVWYLLSARNEAAEDVNRINTVNSVNSAVQNSVTNTTTNSTTTPTTSIPSTVTKIMLNSTTAYYPKSWGTAQTTTTEEKINSDSPFESTYEGAYASIASPFTLIAINNADGYLRDTESIQDAVKFLKKVYSDQSVQPEDVNTLSNAGLVPIQNAGVKPYNPRYLYTSDQKWRGFWYVANIVQEVGLQPYVVALMYNADMNKVYTLERALSSSTITSTEKQIEKNMNDNQSAAAIQISDNYLESAYKQDSDVKKQVDDALEAVELTGIQ